MEMDTQKWRDGNGDRFRGGGGERKNETFSETEPIGSPTHFIRVDAGSYV
jgi:hypothetical protein